MAFGSFLKHCNLQNYIIEKKNLYVLGLKMPHKYNVVGILVLVLIFTDYLCGSVGSVEIAISHKLCKCFNTTNDNNDNGSIKCMCVLNELKEIPNDLPTPLHEL